MCILGLCVLAFALAWRSPRFSASSPLGCMVHVPSLRRARGSGTCRPGSRQIWRGGAWGNVVREIAYREGRGELGDSRCGSRVPFTSLRLHRWVCFWLYERRLRMRMRTRVRTSEFDAGGEGRGCFFAFGRCARCIPIWRLGVCSPRSTQHPAPRERCEGAQATSREARRTRADAVRPLGHAAPSGPRLSTDDGRVLHSEPPRHRSPRVWD